MQNIRVLKNMEITLANHKIVFPYLFKSLRVSSDVSPEAEFKLQLNDYTWALGLYG